MNRNIRQRRACWSDLPPELLSLISGRLESRSAFRAVCKSWRSSTPPPPIQLHPHLPLRVIFNIHGVVFGFSITGFLVVSSMVCILRQPRNPTVKPWLVAIEQSSVGKLRFLHPLTRLPIRNLPQNMSDFSITMLSQGFNIRGNDGVTPAILQPQDKNKYNVNKVVLLPNLPFPSYYVVIVLYGIGNLAFFRLPNVSQEWETIKVTEGLIDDIVLWKGLVWAVNRKGRLLAIDCDPLRVKVSVAPCRMSGYRRNRLVLDSNSELCLVVVTDQSCCDQFDVYKLNGKYDWVKVASLGDMILFVSFDTCFFASSREFPGIQGNCIVFPKNSFPWYNGGSKYSDDALFSNETNEYLQVGVSIYGEGKNFKLISEFPEFCEAFWPPPQWIWQEIISTNSLCYENPLMNGQNRTVADACTTNHHGNINAGIFGVVAPSHINKANIRKTIVLCINLVPKLLELWARHGNTVDYNCESRAMVCESLAKVICIILRTRMKDLTEHQAQHVVATLGDLQFALEVDSIRFDPCSLEGL